MLVADPRAVLVLGPLAAGLVADPTLVAAGTNFGAFVFPAVLVLAIANFGAPVPIAVFGTETAFAAASTA